MTVRRARTPRGKKEQKPKQSWKRIKYLEEDNYLNLAIFILILKIEFGFGKVRIARALEGYLALMNEVADGRRTVNQLMKDATEMSGIDAEEMLKDVMENNYDSWLCKVRKFQEALSKKFKRR